MKLVLFDCDGTLVDSAGIIHSCMVSTFAEHGIDAPHLDRTKSVIGLTLDLAIARMLEREVDAEIAAMTACYKKNFMTYRNSGAPLEPLFDDIAPLIAHLAAIDDVILGIVTGKSRRGLDAILAHHGLERSFIAIRTADDCPSKPHPAMVLECCAETGMLPAETYVIGDAVFDMQMARAAGATAIGVSWGYAAPPALRQAGAHHIVTGATDIPGLLGVTEGQIHA